MTVLSPPYSLGASVDPTPDYLRHSARMDRLSLGAMFQPMTVGVLNAASGFLHGTAGSMGELTLAANGGSVRVNPFRAVVQGTQQSAQGQYVVPNDGPLDLPIPGQDAALARRALLVVGVEDSQAAAVESTEENDRAYVALLSSELSAAPVLPDLPPNAFSCGELTIPRVGQAVTLTHPMPRVGMRHGILPVFDDNSTLPGHGKAPGQFHGQYRRHPAFGLQSWEGESWEPAVGGVVRTAQLSGNWAGSVQWVRVGRLITVQVDLTWRGGLVNVGRWGSVVLASGLPAIFGRGGQDSLSLAIANTNNVEFGGWQFNVGGDGRLYFVSRWVPRSFNKDTWATGSFSYVAGSAT